MNQYHKINTIFKRDMANRGKIIEGEYSAPEIEYLKDNVWTWTEKVDGTNIRVMWDGKNVIFGGKTEAASIPSFLVNQLNELFYKIDKRKLFKDLQTISPLYASVCWNRQRAHGFGSLFR